MNMHYTPYTIDILKTSQKSLIYAYGFYSEAVNELIAVFERNADKLGAHAETLNSVISTYNEMRRKAADPVKELRGRLQQYIDAYTSLFDADLT